jgi:hypothetical protein
VIGSKTDERCPHQCSVPFGAAIHQIWLVIGFATASRSSNNPSSSLGVEPLILAAHFMDFLKNEFMMSFLPKIIEKAFPKSRVNHGCVAGRGKSAKWGGVDFLFSSEVFCGRFNAFF